MALRNTTESYGSIARWLHWLIFALILLMLIFGYIMQDYQLPIGRANAYQLHKSIGITILFLMLLRLFWRWINPTPKLPADLPTWHIAIARTSHYLLYTVVILMPITGWIFSTAAGHAPKFFWLFYWPAPGVDISRELTRTYHYWHFLLATVIIILASIHILAACYHHFIRRDHVLKRMLKG